MWLVAIANYYIRSTNLTWYVAEYFLEDAIEMVHFVPPPSDKKKRKAGELPLDEDDVMMVLICHRSDVMMMSLL